jgi:extradiol dioxygenase family protein
VPGTSITTEKFYGDDWGAIRGTVADTELKFEFINKAGTVVDTYTMTKTLSDPVTTRTVTA